MKFPTIAADAAVDITHEICPMTYVRVRLALDRLQSGQILAVKLCGDDPVRNVPRSARSQGHEVLAQFTDTDGITHLMLRHR